MFWIIFILIYLCSLAIHIAMTYYANKRIVFTIGDLIDEMEFFMWFPVINTLALMTIGVASIIIGIITLLKLELLWEKFRSIKLK